LSANSFGHLFVVSTFGESHGSALGCLIDGCPAGVEFDLSLLQKWMARRRPGQSAVTTSRQESDQVEVLSGVFEGRTLGTPILAIIRNADARSVDYKGLKSTDRPGHATDLWQEKFGHSDPRGSGRASGRETVARVAAAAFAQMFLRQAVPELKVFGFVSQIGPWRIPDADKEKWIMAVQADPSLPEKFAARIPDMEVSQQAEIGLSQAKGTGESFGACVDLFIAGCPIGLGQPVFHKLKSDLCAAMMTVGATAAVEFGEGVDSAAMRGSDFHSRPSAVQYGGIRGGISTGQLVRIKVTLKPTSSLGSVAKQGRHDPCIAPRALVVLEAMATLVLADHVLWRRLDTVTLPK
jgi:chorismate synthase